MPEFLDLHGRTGKLLRQLADEGMRRHGLHLGQNVLLALLWESDGRTPGEIAAEARVSTPTVVKMATRMAAAGLVVRRPDAADQRLVRLWLTDHGRRLQLPVEQERDRLEQLVTAGLSKTERACLLRALARVQQSALELLSEPGPDDVA